MKGENIMNITNQEMMTDLYNITLENAFDIFEKTLYDYKEYLENADDEEITRIKVCQQLNEWTKMLENIKELKRFINEQQREDYEEY